ncbi:MAG: hypothetical protein F6J96_26695 [Symploca sp. SIO1C2]|nr:hypothetical protein [Symploca sp. SIO1C2]
MPRLIAGTQAFIDLFESGFISQQALEEVYQQTRDLEDDEDIADAIKTWIESQNDNQLLEKYNAQFNQLISPNSSESGKLLSIGNSQSQTKQGESNPTSRKLLDSAIATNKPLNKDSSAQSKPNP